MDPSQPQHLPSSPEDGSSSISLEHLLEEQLRLAKTIHKTLSTERDTLTPREYRDLASAANSILSLAHRSEEALRIINTYKLFTETVMQFLRSRSDSLGEDLVGELKKVSRTLDTEKSVNKVLTVV